MPPKKPPTTRVPFRPAIAAYELLRSASAGRDDALRLCLDLVTLHVARHLRLFVADADATEKPACVLADEYELHEQLAVLPEAFRIAPPDGATLLAAMQTLVDFPVEMLTPRLPGECYENLLDVAEDENDGDNDNRQATAQKNTQTTHGGRDQRRVLGAFFTPDWIIAKILAHVFAAGTPLTVCDPAMGSGHFLLAAAEFVGQKFAAPDAARAAARSFAGEQLFGVDRDPLAAQLARRALWLHLSTPGDFFLPPADHFRCGDALLGETFAANPRAPQSLFDTPARNVEANIGDPGGLNWRSAFPSVAAQGGFGAIMGNPPYEVLTNFRARPESRLYAQAIRKTAAYPLALKRQINLYRCFIERSLSLLHVGGIVSLIVPGGLLTEDSAAPLRLALIREHGMDHVEQFAETAKVFAGVNQEVVIFRARKNSGAADSILLQTGVNEDTPVIEAASPRMLPRRITLAQAASLSPTLPLPRATAEDWALIAWLAENITGTFSDLAAGFVGEVDQTVYRAYMLEVKTDTLLLRGHHLKAFLADLNPLPGRERFLDRAGFLTAKGNAATICMQRVNTPRVAQLGIRNRRSTPRLVASEIPLGIFLGNSLNFWLPRNDKRVTPTLICGLLNSRLYDWRFCLTSGNNNINLHEVSPLPCPISWSDEAAQAICRCVKVCEKCAESPSLPAAVQRLDEAVFNFFGIPDNLRAPLHC